MSPPPPPPPQARLLLDSAEARRKALTDLRAAEATQTTSYAWIDKDKGVVQLPLERAMELTVKQYGAKK